MLADAANVAFREEQVLIFEHPDLHHTVLLSSFPLLSSLELTDTKVHEPQIRALPGTASHFCKGVVLRLVCGVCTRAETRPGGVCTGECMVESRCPRGF